MDGLETEHDIYSKLRPVSLEELDDIKSQCEKQKYEKLLSDSQELKEMMEIFSKTVFMQEKPIEGIVENVEQTLVTVESAAKMVETAAESQVDYRKTVLKVVGIACLVSSGGLWLAVGAKVAIAAIAVGGAVVMSSR